jgi:hypothetical protein
MFYESLLLTRGSFSRKRRNIYAATQRIVDWKYTNFMKIGQPKLSERVGQNGGLSVAPAKLQWRADPGVRDYRKKHAKKAEPDDPAFAL